MSESPEQFQTAHKHEKQHVIHPSSIHPKCSQVYSHYPQVGVEGVCMFILYLVELQQIFFSSIFIRLLLLL